MEIWTVHSYAMRCLWVLVLYLPWYPAIVSQKADYFKAVYRNHRQIFILQTAVPAEDGAILVVHHFCTAPVLTVWPAEALLSISYLAKPASNINLPIKMGQVALPEVGEGASEEPPASRSVGAVLLTGQKAIYHLQSAEWDLENICLWPWQTTRIRSQHGLLCTWQKQRLEILWFVWTFTTCASFPRKAMNFKQKCLWCYTAHSTIARPLLSYLC